MKVAAPFQSAINIEMPLISSTQAPEYYNILQMQTELYPSLNVQPQNESLKNKTTLKVCLQLEKDQDIWRLHRETEYKWREGLDQSTSPEQALLAQQNVKGTLSCENGMHPLSIVNVSACLFSTSIQYMHS